MQSVTRLINYFIPEHYQLSLTLEQEAKRFAGTMTIEGQSPEATDKIMVHAKDLSITSVTLDGKEAQFSFGEPDELTITHPDIRVGKHIVVIAFNGTITDAMHGLYPCYYEHNGEKKELLATQFESHHAREVFPCIDEPEAKATFDVTLTTLKGITVLGNMPIEEQHEENDMLVTRFATTPQMSTYLLAWVTGELHRKTAMTKSGVEVSIWATPAQKPESLDFALDVATRTIDFFNDYFDTPYPLPKSDHIALPDFSSGAMENWGLITYREVALLADPETSGISSRQYIALVIAHELSHQWFGNLVTMKWWNNLWLNESFATLMEYIAIDALYPDWNIWLEFSTRESMLALRRDSIDGVQSVQVDVHHPDEIGTLFDGAIVYAKGARLLRMLQHYIGHEAFQEGLKQYFTEFAYQNTEGDDLWNKLSETSGKPIAAFMNTWISQPGFPVVRLASDGSNLSLQQEQFFVGPHKASSQTWPIPLNANQDTLPELFEAKELQATFNPSLALRLNNGDSAHFITQYDQELLSKIIEGVKNGSLQPIDRLQILHEQTLLARSGSQSTATLIPLIQAYQHEESEAVWDIIASALGELRKFVEHDEESEKRLKAFYRTLAAPQYQRLGWTQTTGEPESDTKLRATVIGMMLYGEDESAIQHAIELYKTVPLDSIDAELRPAVVAAMVRNGDDPSIVEKLIAEYKTTALADLRLDIASGFTATRRPKDIELILATIMDSSVVRPQDVIYWFIWTIRNRYGRELAWKWLQNEWEWIAKTFGSDKSYDYFPRHAAGALMTAEQLEEYKQFFVPLQGEPALTRVITLGIAELEGRIDLLARDTEAVRQALGKL
jgi:aminopeptidase N